MANGALNPKAPFSKEHWANSIGLAGLLVGLKVSPVKGIVGEKLPPVKVSNAPVIDSAAATRSRVEANLADSRAARESSNARDYFKVEQILEQERAVKDKAADHYSAQTSRTGPEWNEYFRSKYGDENVDWKTTSEYKLYKDPKSGRYIPYTPKIRPDSVMTKPSLSKGSKPEGEYADTAGKDSRGLKRQNEAADVLAERGYRVIMLDEYDNGYGIVSLNELLVIEGEHANRVHWRYE